MCIYHTHHIIPRHAGGTDDPSNLIQVTIEEHAEAHRILYEEHGRWQDLIAWRTLSGQISTEEARIEAVKRSLTGKVQTPEHVAKRTYKGIKRKPCSEERKRKISAANTGKVRSDEVRRQISIRNANTIWITDGVTSRKISKDTPVPVGWYRGRVLPPSSVQ